MFLLVIAVGYSFHVRYENRRTIDFSDHLNEVVFSVDGQDVTLADLSFYVLYVERNVEEQAMIYNRESTKDYWNIHTNDAFIQEEAKDTIINMAIHDRLFYQMATDEKLSLSDEDLENMNYAITDFWEDLFDCQHNKLPVSKELIEQQIMVASLAEKYQNELAKANGPSVAAYKYDGYEYSLILQQHQVDINDRMWDRIIVGDITLVHDVSYVNGWDHEKEKKNKKE